MRLQRKLERQARSMGARFFGVADLTVAREAIVAQGGEFLATYPRALAVGIALSDGIVDQLPRHKEVVVARTYDRLYDTVNRFLDRIALRLSVTLNGQGFRTLLIPASDKIDDENLVSLFSHKLAARLAGLGWIGPSCLLVTPEVGPRVRWVTVLTDAPLEAGGPLSELCGDCQRCVKACPPQAFTGRPFDPDEPREARFDVHRCQEYRIHLRDEVTGVRTCGMCVYVCPYGHKEAPA
ncbi:MAG: epoxyqueuosine reductase [Anaerolineales bacterium]|nr:MAG: epoxyqueuosine reductase [Anaerolineales bacterium]